MKKYLNLWLIFFSLLLLNQSYFLDASDCGRCAISDCQTNTKTFFRSRSIIEDVSFFLGLNYFNYYGRYFGDEDLENKRINLVGGIFFEKSRLTTNNNVGRFFFSGTTSTNEAPSPTTNESIILISPERRVVGAYFDYHQDFGFCNHLWLDIKLALYQATHNLNARETCLSIADPTSCTPLGYLSSSLLRFGRISLCPLKKTGLDDIEVKLGYNFFNCDDNSYLGIYASVLLPTAPKPTGEFLFEPLVGRKHWGVGGGINGAREMYRSEDISLTILTDFSYQYLFKGREIRSLDFTEGQLTRFMIANTNLPTTIAPTAAINLTTFNLEVTPRGIINFWLAAHIQHCKWHTELGYNLWWRQSEKICFQECQQSNCTDLGISGVNGFIPITLNNLNLASASHPKTLTNKIYLAFSRDIQTCRRLMNIGLGGAYEFSRNINSLGQWGIWINAGVAFDTTCAR